MKLPKLTKQQYIVIGSVAGISVMAAMVVAIVFVIRKQLNSKQTMGNKTTGSAGVALIKQFEGCRLTAYKPVPTEQYYTIGYGHYGADVQAGQTITQAEAETLLRNDLQRFEACINAEGLTISQNQFDALVSLCYNIGEGNLRASTLLRKVKANPNDASIADEFLRWNKSGGITLAGLTRRRQAEADLYFS
ncbi:MAG: lysozyme [Paludibacteraceae bacterium]